MTEKPIFFVLELISIIPWVLFANAFGVVNAHILGGLLAFQVIGLFCMIALIVIEVRND